MPIAANIAQSCVSPTVNKNKTGDMVSELHACGWQDEAIAAQLGVCRSAVTYHRRVRGLPAWGRVISDDRKASIAAMHSDGLADPAIAKVLGVDRSTVAHHRARFGLPAINPQYARAQA